MFEFHQDKNTYFSFQSINSEKYVIPFIESLNINIDKSTKVLEVGCAEGGVLQPFLNKGCTCIGIELDAPRIETGKILLKEQYKNGQIQFYGKNIFDEQFAETLKNTFDIIILKDVVEHIFEKEKLFYQLKSFLKPNGIVFFGFPPIQMPFGGHQQISPNKILSKLPYYHLLPKFILKFIFNTFFKKDKDFYNFIADIKDCGISIEGFEKYSQKTGFKILAKKFYLINPIYELKFGLKVREQFKIISKIPYFRNYVTTAVFYIVQK